MTTHSSLGSESRKVAETHYMIALAYQLGDSSEDALRHFEVARKVMNKQIEANKDNVELVNELTEILKELEQKIEEESVIAKSAVPEKVTDEPQVESN